MFCLGLGGAPPPPSPREVVQARHDRMRGQYMMIHYICTTGDIYIGVNKVGSARNRIRAIDNARDWNQGS